MGYFFRLVIIAIALWLIIQLLRRAFRPPPAKPPLSPSRMLPCAYCGLHVPETQAIVRAGRAYCSKEHVALESRQD